jgi:integrase
MLTSAQVEARHSEAARAPYTVADAVHEYLADYSRRGGKGLSQTTFALNAHILPTLGAIRLDRLSRQRLTAWRNGLADAAPRLRSAKDATERKVREIDAADPDALRRRRATANRVLSILKAALNHAHQAGHVGSKEAWAAVKPFRGADAPKVRFLNDVEATRSVNASPPDLRLIVIGALLTGMRYGEIARLRVRDLNEDSGTACAGHHGSGRSAGVQGCGRQGSVSRRGCRSAPYKLPERPRARIFGDSSDPAKDG